MGKVKTGLMIALAGAALLSACAEPEQILPGPREDLRPDTRDQQQFESRAEPVSLPAQRNNADWPQRHGTPAFRTDHPALSASPQLVWSAGIGAGDKRRARITATPIVAGGRVFTLDSGAQVVATSTQGERLWAQDLRPERERDGQATGGGIAYDDGRVYVSSGYGLMTVLEAETGAVVWQQKLEATGSGTPTVAGDLVYLVSGDDTAWAIEKDNGRIRWQLSAAPDVDNVLGGPAPALTDQFVIFSFGAGDLQAAFRNGGLRMWNTAISGQRRFRASTKVTDITGDPVIVGDTAYVGTHSGRTVALRVDNGERIWTADDGAMGPVWPTGNAIFLVNDRNELVRLSTEDGSRVWVKELPRFTKSRTRRQVEVYAHYGPVLAGGRLVVASSDGFLRFFDPASGDMVQQVELPGGASTAPVVAGGTLYVVGTGGQLHAFR
ncbi:PQQ-like beta-propeller repeat protein [Lutimaribacter sp. EGI FJ00015]|uniref:PQQ-like beta-propeller repeat protein n=1 Tax=Lutimaribacter degradans TaxID=2945989 RepID=A0ACC5ZTF4_9RHOB|nr:PQQ-like beta-propeller repeat protein [Lutimaribacter sp. EGI FJ00013]MCM2561228.1 PQQ-like beta-propeller repeat protein [Lutimaribacter sp. EGI FJ00013]MCO0611823.1 PQQ-like beta-propeller repeat protein [Lutimaribacter sp. EGI FJ00015]MCO0635056.1 PQQ-like beta-propeller repeat protein [Lutimaribacter sp. EGI FJ00014]